MHRSTSINYESHRYLIMVFNYVQMVNIVDRHTGCRKEACPRKDKHGTEGGRFKYEESAMVLAGPKK